MVRSSIAKSFKSTVRPRHTGEASPEFYPSHLRSSRSSASDIQPKWSTTTLGKRGEAVAAQYLTRNGYRILARNWKWFRGELDIVCADGDTFVVVEVKSRYESRHARRYLFDTVTRQKQCRLRLLATFAARRMMHRAGCRGLRIDAIGVLFDRDTGEPTALKHLRAAVGAS